jgi:hypothetical protein
MIIGNWAILLPMNVPACLLQLCLLLVEFVIHTAVRGSDSHRPIATSFSCLVSGCFRDYGTGSVINRRMISTETQI